jgi:GH24 family phage-related lysozyme (muramidase)
VSDKPKFLHPTAGVGDSGSKFGVKRKLPGREEAVHKGLDIKASSGTQAQAIFSGRVSIAGDVPGYGNAIYVDSEDGKYRAIYGHMSRVDVREGQVLQAGQRVGLTGGGASDPGKGNALGAHLHFEIRRNIGHGMWNPVDPEEYIDFGEEAPGQPVKPASPIIIPGTESSPAGAANSSATLEEKIRDTLFGEEALRNKAYIVELKDSHGNVRKEAGNATIGIGHKIKKGEEYLLTKTLSDKEAWELFEKDIAEHQSPWINNLDRSKVTDNMLIAMTDAAFNMGGNAKLFPQMVALINAGKKKEAADLLGKWGKTATVEDPVTGAKISQESPALAARVARRKEAFLADDSVDARSIFHSGSKKKARLLIADQNPEEEEPTGPGWLEVDSLADRSPDPPMQQTNKIVTSSQNGKRSLRSWVASLVKKMFSTG